MDEDLRIITDFFNYDEEVKKNLSKNFYQWGEITFEEITDEIVGLLRRKLDLTDVQIDELRYSRRRIGQKLTERFFSCSEEFVADFSRIKTSPEELTHGTLAVDEETYDEAVMYCRRLRGKLDLLESNDIAKRNSGSPFSNFSQSGVDFIRSYVEDSFDRQSVRNFDYYCESEVRDRLEIGVRMASRNVYLKSSEDIDELQGCTRRMNKQDLTRTRTDLESFLK